ncbi:hypothetical protein MNBD_NITROSPINAE02-96 [hydrothermal vent metagenome]|uniref:DUF1858 domain-containing protein n=1 Tax=hydrothermal vent metagenome TaxID=652676 RepID=A0A3B1D673_9ZZZZ
MDKWPRNFIKASLIYMGLGVLMGLAMAFTDLTLAGMRFIHVHLMLLGFMAMMIYGVAYHIMPRFNAKPLPFDRLVGLQFWLANVGLLGMVTLYGAGAFWGPPMMRMAFGVFGLLEAISIFIFIANIYAVVSEKPALAPQPKADTPAEPQIKVKPSMKINEIVDKWPHLEERLIELGFGDVAAPATRNTIGKMISLEMAAKKEGKDIFELIAQLEGKKLISAEDKAAPASPLSGDSIARGDMATQKTLIGALLETYPETKPVFEEHYGEGCFTCPGQATETIEQTAMMHNMPAEKILGEVNSIIEKSLK